MVCSWTLVHPHWENAFCFLRFGQKWIKCFPSSVQRKDEVFQKYTLRRVFWEVMWPKCVPSRLKSEKDVFKVSPQRFPKVPFSMNNLFDVWCAKHYVDNGTLKNIQCRTFLNVLTRAKENKTLSERTLGRRCIKRLWGFFVSSTQARVSAAVLLILRSWLKWVKKETNSHSGRCLGLDETSNFSYETSQTLIWVDLK